MMDDATRGKVEAAIEGRHPGLVRDDARWNLAEWAEFLRLEHPEFGVETEDDLVIALMLAEAEG